MPWAKGESGNPGGMAKKTAAVRNAERLLRKGSPRAAKRLLELCESEDPKVAVAACKVVLAKVVPDMKHVEVAGKVEHEHTGLNPERRRAVLDALGAAGIQAATH